VFDKTLHELEFAEVKAFLDQEVPEGPSLDYKETLTSDPPDSACALANTAGDYVILGVAESR
jgi:predicted HTH transcriptional regulator